MYRPFVQKNTTDKTIQQRPMRHHHDSSFNTVVAAAAVAMDGFAPAQKKFLAEWSGCPRRTTQSMLVLKLIALVDEGTGRPVLIDWNDTRVDLSTSTAHTHTR
jgi:hypothetical protein